MVSSAGYRTMPSLLVGVGLTDMSPPRVETSQPDGTPTWKPSYMSCTSGREHAVAVAAAAAPTPEASTAAGTEKMTQDAAATRGPRLSWPSVVMARSSFPLVRGGPGARLERRPLCSARLSPVRVNRHLFARAGSLQKVRAAVVTSASHGGGTSGHRHGPRRGRYPAEVTAPQARRQQALAPALLLPYSTATPDVRRGPRRVSKVGQLGRSRP